ncbi:MAG: hypothetical protein ACI9XO_003484, partial [Paraglaciecola sp.]
MDNRNNRINPFNRVNQFGGAKLIFLKFLFTS